MSTSFHDHFSNVANRYADFRPHSPAALFDYLATLVPRDSVVFLNSYLLIDRRQGKWGLAATMGIGGLPRP